MHICIDGNEANVKNRVGSNVYAFEVLKQLEKISRNKTDLMITVLLRNQPLKDLPNPRNGWSYQVFGPMQFWTQLALPIHLYFHKKDYDIFFSPGHYAPFVCPLPSVVTVMDTAYLDFPDHFKPTDLFQLTHWTKRAVHNAKKVIAISNSTKKSVIDHYHKDPAQIEVAYPGIEMTQKILSPAQSKSFLKKLKITQPYILFVGTIQPRKNIPILIESFEILSRMTAGRALRKNVKNKTKLPNIKLVLAGKIGWLAEETLARIDTSSLKKDIIQTGFINDSQKVCLYQNAMATVLLGQGEGFGLPPLEALACGTPVVVAKDSSLPEVAGDVGVQVSQNDPQETAQALYEIHGFTARERARYRKLAIEHSKNFTWNNTAKVILKTLTSVVA